MKGISIDIYVHSERVKYIVLKKKSRTKLVLNADTQTEFDGWLKTLDIEIKRQEELQLASSEKSYVNVELPDPSERGRGLTKVKTKTPVPTPRNRTPCRDTARDMGTTNTGDTKRESSCREQHHAGESQVSLIHDLVR